MWKIYFVVYILLSYCKQSDFLEVTQSLFSVIVDEESGNTTCLTDVPNFAYDGVDRKNCAMFCQWTIDCAAFNFWEKNKTCEIYTSQSLESDTKTGCKSFQLVVKEIDEDEGNFTSCSNTVGVNLALRKPVLVSKQHPTWLAKTLTDGRSTYIYPYCAATYESVNAPNWFLIDLLGIFQISSVVVYNRVDGYSHKLSKAYVGAIAVYNATYGIVRNAYPLCAQYKYLSTGIRRLEFVCGDTMGPARHVIIQQAASPEYPYDGHLTACEALVYGSCVCSNETFEKFWRRCYSPLYYDYPRNKAISVTANLAVGRPIYSNFDDDKVILAVDGTWLTCVTLSDTAGLAYLVVDLVRVYFVSAVALWNSVGPTGFIKIGVTELFTVNQAMLNSSYVICSQIANSTYTKKVNKTCTTPIRGQFVVIHQQSDYNQLSVCEIEVYGVKDEPRNIALRMIIKSSSTYGTMQASRLVDGDYSALVAAYCAATNDLLGGPNWFCVDLLYLYHLSSVTFWNRDDGGTSRLSYVIVGVSATNMASITRNTYPLCGTYPSKSSYVIKLSVNCSIYTPPARYLIVQQATVFVDGYLNFCELQAYGDYACWNNSNINACFCPLFPLYPSFSTRAMPNLALGRPVTMNSGNNSCRAVDGNTNRIHPSGLSCVRTNPSAAAVNHWIVVNLLRYSIVDTVYITNMDITTGVPGPYLTNVTVSLFKSFVASLGFNNVNKTKCGVYGQNSTKVARVTVGCAVPKPVSQFVMVSRLFTYLALCEIEVDGRLA